MPASDAAHAAPAQCENCATALQGPYCHVCGQHAHNPLRSFGHAVEEVLESFWHLDGRLFRTLRDLCVPGRLAANFLAGHRARYVPPLRLFLVLSVLTFFVGKLTLHIDLGDAVQVDGGGTRAAAHAPERLRSAGDDVDTSDFAAAKTVDEVFRMRTEQQRALAKAQQDPGAGWLLTAVGDVANEEIDAQARARLQQLGATPAQLHVLDTPVAAPGADAPQPAAESGGVLQRWFQHRLTRLKENAERVRASPDEFIRLVLGAVPGALFLLVPVFALCLRLLYLRGRYGYLEHLVVAFYSHAFMLVALLADFLLVGLGAVPGVPAPVAGGLIAVGSLLVFLLVPVYLLWMQKRVYAQGWFATLAKYTVLGSVYAILLSFVLVYAVLAGLSS
ncbi:MAG TPA: DUF3667 domain-containing protein [Thermomonas sp.]|nr:DUF3667 domain-containing protein [Thermomonas sp.]